MSSRGVAGRATSPANAPSMTTVPRLRTMPIPSATVGALPPTVSMTASTGRPRSARRAASPSGKTSVAPSARAISVWKGWRAVR